MIKGSCLCGRVAYEIAGPLTDVVNCHCGMCRKAHGAAFRTRATVQAADFKWTRGENHITWYCSSPGNYRGFCEACGTRPAEPPGPDAGGLWTAAGRAGR